MNVKRFTASTSREALTWCARPLARTPSCCPPSPAAEGVEVLAMAPDGVRQIEHWPPKPRPAPPPSPAPRRAADAPTGCPRQRPSGSHEPARPRPTPGGRAGRRAAGDEHADLPGLCARAHAQAPPGRARAAGAGAGPAVRPQRPSPRRDAARRRLPPASAAARARQRRPRRRLRATPPRRERQALPTRRSRRRPQPRSAAAARAAQQHELLGELRSMKGLIEDRFGALAFMEKLQREPRQAR